MRWNPHGLPGAVLRVRRLGRSLFPQRINERGHVTSVFRRQFVDAGDQEVALGIARVLRPGLDAVVVMQPGGLRRGGADYGYRHVEALGQRIERGRARRPGQVPGRRERIDGGTRKLTAPGDVAVGPGPPRNRCRIRRWSGLIPSSSGAAAAPGRSGAESRLSPVASAVIANLAVYVR